MSTTTMPETGALVKTEDAGLPSVYLEGNPEVVLAEAHRAAVALQGVLDSKPKKLVFNNRRYLESEDWVTVARFYGITGAAIGDPEFVAFDAGDGDVVRGFKATFAALRNGTQISQATAYCLSDEEKWGTRPKYEWHYVRKSDGGTQLEDPGKAELVWVEGRPQKKRVLVGEEKVPLYQLASMAQTRAMSKVLAQVLKWVVVLAGYAPTPAEEMTDVQGAQVIDAEVSHREPGADDGEVVQTSVGPVTIGKGQHAAAAGATDYGKYKHPEPQAPAGRGPRPECPQCGSNAKVINAKFKRDKGTWYCMAPACKLNFGPQEQPAGRVDSFDGDGQ